MQKRSKIIVSAHELNNYVFCKRVWWLRFHGFDQESNKLELGTLRHDRLVWQALISRKIFIVGFILLIIGLVILVYALLSNLNL